MTAYFEDPSLEDAPRAPSTWLYFRVGGFEYAIPVDAVTEALAARRPHLVPLLPLEIGGVLNIRGEPLPVVDGGAALQNVPCGATRHVLVFERPDMRLGLLVDYITRIHRDFDPTRMDLLELADGVGECVEAWRRSSDVGVLGIVNSDALLARAASLFAGRSSQMKEEPCPNAF